MSTELSQNQLIALIDVTDAVSGLFFGMHRCPRAGCSDSQQPGPHLECYPGGSLWEFRFQQAFPDAGESAARIAGLLREASCAKHGDTECPAGMFSFPSAAYTFDCGIIEDNFRELERRIRAARKAFNLE